MHSTFKISKIGFEDEEEDAEGEDIIFEKVFGKENLGRHLVAYSVRNLQ
jgi:hypothetical protein